MRDLDQEIAEALREYSAEIQEELLKTAKKLGNQARKDLKSTSPRGSDTKHYADSWRVSVEQGLGDVQLVIHNASKSGLTHLLEHGHLNVNGTRTKPIPHIAPVQEELNEAWEKAVTDLLKGGKGK